MAWLTSDNTDPYRLATPLSPLPVSPVSYHPRYKAIYQRVTPTSIKTTGQSIQWTTGLFLALTAGNGTVAAGARRRPPFPVHWRHRAAELAVKDGVIGRPHPIRSKTIIIILRCVPSTGMSHAVQYTHDTACFVPARSVCIPVITIVCTENEEKIEKRNTGTQSFSFLVSVDRCRWKMTNWVFI